MRSLPAIVLTAALGIPASAAVPVSSFEEASPGTAVGGEGVVVADGEGISDGRQALRLPLSAVPEGHDGKKIGHLVVDNGFLTRNPAGFAADGIALSAVLPAAARSAGRAPSLRVAIFHVGDDDRHVYHVCGVIAGENLDGTVSLRFDEESQAVFEESAVRRGYAQLEFALVNPGGLTDGTITIDDVRLLTPDDADPADPADAPVEPE
ncbi:hypothetical protein [Phycisphaera mikurensis]|uniref:Uncharacterized protein n=1 Tax=Phycisphaera mikurensis (strain NBRC 102666 / KCTC 22515 / FYK2301M01) TaxID=1142394 RepID=I0IGY1_PHYMF|nr:hypothetical protein [Phycisphaera mikurensis]MBB6440776.1 hypothetical protein [Phycisphaera mikurensis]BAM04519.1 hypothetical protein PSMK_23600 [Phycisphaera mikurensis NBRC 102666]